MSEKGMTTCTM